MSCYATKMNFIHIPKNAGTSVLRWIGETYLKFHDYKSCHYSASKMAELHPDAKMSFAIVRNPWDRMVSMYRYAIERSDLTNQRYNKKITNKEPTFEEFVKEFRSYESIYWYDPSTPQSAWLDARVDYILRYERLDSDFKIIQDLVGNHEPLGRYNTTHRVHYTHYYNDQLINMVGDYFSEDVDRFEYDYR